ncbi:unnamed protein product [marine sediment metagenome]|uniref:Uncharacterized protein n=1 Tax=marine sediment metagenome TaxID=412755 RepID=X0RYP6_9ZZZZ
MKAKAKILDKVDISCDQEGTILGDLKPNDCKYFLFSRTTGVYLVIIKMSKNGKITIIERKIGRKKNGK